MNTKKITIVHIIPKFVFGGAERLVALYGTLHDPELYDVYIVACVEDGPLRAQMEQGHATIFAASRTVYGGRWGSVRALMHYLDTVQPDIIHTHLLTSDVLGWWYRLRATKRPLWISTQHNVEDTRPWLHKRIWKSILPTADAVIAVAPRVHTFAKHVFHVPTIKLHTILNGIPVAIWNDAARIVPCVQPTLRIGTIGRLETQKGHTYALAALAQLPESVDWTYHVYGEGSLQPELMQQASTLGISEKIVWHGVASDMHVHIASLDIVLQPSLFEGLSLVILESLTAGRVVVTTPAGGEGIITHGTDGYIVPDKNLAAIASTLSYIAAHREESQAVSRAAHVLGGTCSIEKSVDAIEALYAQCLKKI